MLTTPGIPASPSFGSGEYTSFITFSEILPRNSQADTLSSTSAHPYSTSTPTPQDLRSSTATFSTNLESSSKTNTNSSTISTATIPSHPSLQELAALWDKKYHSARSPSATALLSSAQYHHTPHNTEQKLKKWDAVRDCMHSRIVYADQDDRFTKLYSDENWSLYNIEYLWTKSGKHLLSGSPTEPDGI